MISRSVYGQMIKAFALGVSTLFVCAVLTVAPAYAASLTGASPGTGAVISGSSVTFTLSFSNNVAGNEAWATNQSAFSVYDENGTYYPCAPSRNYFGNTPGDTPDPEGMRRLIFVTVSNLQPGMNYTLSGSGLYTQGHVAIPAFSISFSTEGQPEAPDPEPSEPEAPDTGDTNGEGGAGDAEQGGSASGTTPGEDSGSDGNGSNSNSETHAGSQNNQANAPVADVTLDNQQKPADPSHEEASTHMESTQNTEAHQASGEGVQASGGTHYYAVKDLRASVPEEDKAEETVVTAFRPLLMCAVAVILVGVLARSLTWFAHRNIFVYEGLQSLRRVIKKH